MSSMICLSCAELRPSAEGCPECGTLLVPLEPSHLESLVQVRLVRRLRDWREQGIHDTATALGLIERGVTPPPRLVSPGLNAAAALERWADGVAASFRQALGWRPGWGSELARSLEEAARAEREAGARRGARGEDAREDDLGLAVDSGSALFSASGPGALGNGLDAVVALDGAGGAPSREGSLKLHEYVWWFLGALLVLGGSLMGVREAWRALGGVPRQLIVTGALFVYHAGFIGLGVFLARRALSAGRVVAGIGLALLPVVFVGLASLMALAPGLGVAGAVLVSGLGLLTLRAAGRLLHGVSAASLAVALFPSLLAGLPLMWLGDASWPRALGVFAGVGALGASLWRGQKAGPGLAPLVGAGAALYGALALALFSVASGPNGFEALEPGTPTFAGMALWAVALAAVLAGAATRAAVREAYPRAAPVVEVVAYAVMAGGALAGAVASFSVAPRADLGVSLVSALTPAAACLAFFLLEPRRHALAHLGVVAATATGFLLARLLEPNNEAWWVVGSAAVASGLLLVARRCEGLGLRMRLLNWGVLLSVASLPAVFVATQEWGPGSPWPKVATGALVGVAAHLAGGHRWRGLHYLGGVAVPFAGLALLLALSIRGGDWGQVAVSTLAAVLYGLAALVHGAWARRTGHSLSLSPLDDLSLVGASLGVLLFASLLDQSPGSGEADRVGQMAFVCAPTALASALLLLRARRDKSRLVSFLAASGLALLAVVFSRAGLGWELESTTLVPAALGLGFAVFATLRGRGLLPVEGAEAAPRPRGRKLLGAINLPFPERGLPLFTDGFAGAAIALVGVATLSLGDWVSTPDDAERPLVLLAGGLLVASTLLAFLTRGFVASGLRGSVLTLAIAGGLIALLAVINRAGRPLPPDLSAWRLPIVGVGLWFVALAARRFGPWLARRLENVHHGSVYHLVPHAGVAALAVVLASKAWSVGVPNLSRALAVVPPLTLLGAALLFLLLAASFHSLRLTRLGLMLGLPGAALWAAQQSLLGVGLVDLAPPAGQWGRAELADTVGLFWLHPEAWLPPGVTVALLWQRAFAGIAAAGLVYASAALVQARVGARLDFLRRLLSWVPEESREGHALRLGIFSPALLYALRVWSMGASGLVFAAAFFQPGLPSAALTFATGAVLFLGLAGTQGRVVMGAGLLLIIHAVAHRAEEIAGWPGPVLASVGLALVVLSPWVARLRGADEGAVRVRVDLAAALYALCGTVYALGAGGDTHATVSVPNLLWQGMIRLDGRWMLSGALPVTAALIATTLLVGAFRWRGAMAGMGAGWGSSLAGFAVFTGVSSVLAAQEGWGQPSHGMLISTSGTVLALAVATSSAVLHAAGRWLQARRADVGRGLRLGRDGWLLGSAGLLALVASSGQGVDGDALPQALAALGLAVGVALHCAWSEHTGRHVYFVQLAVVGVYALVRSLYATELRPEHDALFALVLGFLLVGVTVMARRAGIPPVADATRRFAALLPLLVWLVLPEEATGEAALLAGGSGLLYAAIGAVEQSRLFGSLAAAACNLALLIAALAYGLEGLEVYLAPLGLLLLMLGQLFTRSLPQAARNAVRVLGGMLLYVPAAAKLSLQVGLAEDGMYALVFGGACLVGVMVGMVLHIRAYLALGTLFLTLDVVANLVHAGLRDHRVGFVVMTLTGLTIVGGRVLATLKRQQFELLVRRVRVELRGWD